MNYLIFRKKYQSSCLVLGSWVLQHVCRERLRQRIEELHRRGYLWTMRWLKMPQRCSGMFSRELQIFYSSIKEYLGVYSSII